MKKDIADSVFPFLYTSKEGRRGGARRKQDGQKRERNHRTWQLLWSVKSEKKKKRRRGELFFRGRREGRTWN